MNLPTRQALVESPGYVMKYYKVSCFGLEKKRSLYVNTPFLIKWHFYQCVLPIKQITGCLQCIQKYKNSREKAFFSQCSEQFSLPSRPSARNPQQNESDWVSRCVCVGVRVYRGGGTRCKLLLGVHDELAFLPNQRKFRNLCWTGKVYLLPKKGGREQRPTLHSMVKGECLIVSDEPRCKQKLETSVQNPFRGNTAKLRMCST